MATPYKCPYCGTSVSPAARYCDSCGTPLKQTERPAPARRKEHPRHVVAVWAFVSILVIIFATGIIGGYRYNAGQWPWEPIVSLTAGVDQPPETPPSSIPGPPGGQRQDPDLRRYLRAVVAINVRGEQGSKTGLGFLIGKGGHIVTSAHVIEGYRDCVNVIDDNGTTHLGTVVNLDANRDVAMIHVPTLKTWPDVLEIRSAPPARGDQLYVLGSPKGTPNSGLLQAQVEATGVSKRIDDRYYTNLVEFRGATIVHGSSGGPLLHRESGQVVGVVTAGADTSIAAAVPIDQNIKGLLDKWAAEPVKRGCGTESTLRAVKLFLATITPLSGTHGVWGDDLASGAELALRDMEADLRKVGYEISLQRYDDQGGVEKARELARAVVYDQEVIGVVGSFTSQVSLGIAEALRESGLVMIAPVAGADELTARGWPHFNRIVASNARLEAAAATFLKNRLKSEPVLLVLDGSEIADSRAASFETSAQIISLPVAGRLKLPGGISAGELKRKVSETGAGAIYYAGNSQTGFQLVQALRQEGITLPVIGGAELYNSSFTTLTGPQWRSVYFTHFTNGVDERFERHFETILGKPTRGYGMYGYDATKVILEALVRYGETHPAQVPTRAQLAHLVRQTQEHPGWSAKISFDAQTGENQAARVFVFEWVQGHHELRD